MDCVTESWRTDSQATPDDTTGFMGEWVFEAWWTRPGREAQGLKMACPSTPGAIDRVRDAACRHRRRAQRCDTPTPAAGGMIWVCAVPPRAALTSPPGTSPRVTGALHGLGGRLASGPRPRSSPAGPSIKWTRKCPSETQARHGGKPLAQVQARAVNHAGAHTLFIKNALVSRQPSRMHGRSGQDPSQPTRQQVPLVADHIKTCGDRNHVDPLVLRFSRWRACRLSSALALRRTCTYM